MSLLLTFLIIEPYFIGLKLYANAGGPTQPEFSGYTAIGNSDFVDPFTGNVAYSIPLFEIGGYPVTLSYSGDINPHADAGWVGLGWTLNLGSINRAMRGIPDDFDGDEVNVKRNSKPNINANIVFNNIKSETVGMQEKRGNSTYGQSGKIKMASYKLGLSWDNNTGIGIGYGASWEKRTDQFSTSDPYDFSKPGDSTAQITAKLLESLKMPLVKGADTTFTGIKYSPSFSIDYNSKSRTTISSNFINETGKLSFLKNANINFNSKSSQVDLGIDFGTPIKNNGQFAYGADFSKFYGVQVPPPETRTRTYTLQLDFSKGTPIRQKRKLSGVMTVTEEHIVNKNVNKKAYGYFHMTNKNFEEGSIIDCQELPNSINKQMEKYSRQLSPATKTYDIFNISAAGIGGSFRAHHNSVFMISPTVSGSKPYVNNLSLKGEFGKSELGVDIGIGINKEKYGPIPDKHNDIVNKLKFKDEILNNAFEPTTYRNDYEFIENDINYLNSYGGTEAIRPNISNRFGRFDNKFFDKNYNKKSNTTPKVEINGEIAKTNRDARQQVISCNTAKKASKTSLFKQIENYKRTSTGNPDLTLNNGLIKESINRNLGHRKDHHISEIVVTQPDGSRYFFSTPVYNKNSKEVSFDASELNKSNFNYVNGTVKYNTSDLKITEKGNNARFYEEKTIPSYASTFLLNGVISPDYVDIDNNGPTENDLGNYVKFNYSLHNTNFASTESDLDFKWRSPVEQGTANLSSGFKSDDLDDKAYYSYGEKELWYAHSIETKDQIALFYLKPRFDGWGVNNEFGGINNSGITQQYLHQIVLYSKNEFKSKGMNAIPLKVVNLDYSYDLCGNYSSYSINSTGISYAEEHPLDPNYNDTRYQGKLTLHKVWFTYGSLGVPTAAPYILEYNTINPEFKNKSIDRWGTYLPEDYYQNGGNVNNLKTTSNADYPFTPQDIKASTDEWASAWMLSDITLPSGGKIHFDYESDDYAYVQNKRAMRMLKIHGVNNSPNVNGSKSDLYSHQEGNNKNYYIIFQKNTNKSASSFYEKGDLVYYSFNVRMNRKNENSYENVSGFFEVDEIGNANDNSQFGYIKVKRERAGIFNAHPVTRMALQYGLTNVPHNLYPGSDLRRSGFKPRAIADMIFGVIPDAMSMLMGKYNYFEKFDFCQKIEISKSYIRVPEVDGFKYGGGHRVKKVTLSDYWSEMTNNVESTSNYAIEYDYTTKNQSNEIESSGVASYEPDAGAEENPWKEPLNAEAIKKMRNKRMKPLISYDLGPVGEEFFGAPSVGYSKITIKNVYPNSNIIRHKTGYTVKEFYTARDFPALTERTPIQLKKVRFGTPSLSGKFSSKASKNNTEEEGEEKDEKDKKKKFGSLSLDISASFSFMTATQGLSVETNDMHGKPKAEWVYAEDGIEALSGQKFYYKTRDIDKLSNEIRVLRPNQTISKTTAGLTVEPTLYGSQRVTTTHNIRPNFNIDRAGAAILINVLPGYTLHREQTRLVTMTKHVIRKGILDSVVVFDKGASTSTKNLAWDALTGQVLLSSVKNEYGDEVYSIVKPAHWMYKGMSGAYQNQNIKVELTTVSGIANDPSNKLFQGDELYKDDLSDDETYFVLDRNSTQVTIIDKNGNSIPNSTYIFRVKRSGHRNILGQTAEAVSLLKNPLNLSNNTFTIDKDWVVDAKAFVYEDIRRVLPSDRFCFKMNCPLPNDTNINNDTTSFGHELLKSPDINVFPMPIPGEQASYFGKPTFNNCCNNEGGGIGIMNMPPPNGGGEGQGGNNCMYSCGSGGYEVNDIVNPYLLGIRGIWRINGEYVYFEKRNAQAQRVQDLTNTSDANTTTMRYDGRLVDYKEFWTFSSNNWISNSSQIITNPWTWKESVTHTDNFGNPIQTINALDINSTQLFGYNQRRLVIATAANAKHRNIMFDGFEDINTNSFLSWRCDSTTGQIIDFPILNNDWVGDFCSQYRHWPIAKALLGGNNKITDKISHTGWKSIQLGRGETKVPLTEQNFGYSNPNISLLSNYHLANEDFIDRFFPESDKDYLVSMWVKQSYKNQFEFNILDQNGNPITLTQEGTKSTVDGWKKLTYKFTLGLNQSIGTILFKNNAPLNNKLKYCYLDDIRIAPIKSAMKCYVYDLYNFKIMATLDDNNFATYFEYDEEGDLVRHKVETEKGIMTVDENRKNTRR